MGANTVLGAKTPERTPGNMKAKNRTRTNQKAQKDSSSLQMVGPMTNNSNVKNEQITQNFYNQNILIMQNSPNPTIGDFQQAAQGQNMGQGLFPYMAQNPQGDSIQANINLNQGHKMQQ